MLDSTLGRVVIGSIAAFAVIALLAWARNDPGVGGRQPDPPTSNVVVVVPVPQPTTTTEPAPPTT